jgi:hypothetical protein
MRKEIVERNKKHEMSQVATPRKRNKTGKKSISGKNVGIRVVEMEMERYLA